MEGKKTVTYHFVEPTTTSSTAVASESSNLPSWNIFRNPTEGLWPYRHRSEVRRKEINFNTEIIHHSTSLYRVSSSLCEQEIQLVPAPAQIPINSCTPLK